MARLFMRGFRHDWILLSYGRFALCRTYLTLLLILCLSTMTWAESVTLSWKKATEATSYEIELSQDQGESWTVMPTPLTCLITICKTTLIVPDDRMVLLRVVSVNAGGRMPRANRGIWVCAPCKLVDGVTQQTTP
jgi:hypothetical protein